MTNRVWPALLAVSLSVAGAVAQPCHNHVVPGYSVGSLIGTVNSGAVFDDHSGTGPALFIAGNSGAQLRIANQGIGLAKLVDGHWVVNTSIVGNVTCLAALDDGSGPALYVGGVFQIAPSTTQLNVAKWDGTTWLAYPTLNASNGSLPPVSAMVVHNDGSGPALYVGGTLSGGSLSSRGLVRWNGQAWEGLGTGLFSTMLPVVRALESFDDGTGNKLYVGGDFSSAGGVTVTGLASWDGAQWAAVGPGFASGNYRSVVYSLAVHDDGTGPGLYAAGVINLPDRNYGNSPVALWKNGTWTRALDGLDADPTMEAGGSALVSLDDGTGPALYAAVGHLVEGANRVMRLHEGSWDILGSPLFTTNDPSGFGATVNTLVSLPTPDGPRLVSLGNTTSSGVANAPPAAEWNRGTWNPVEAGALGLAGPATVVSDAQRVGGPLFASGFMLTDEGWSADLGGEPYPSAGYVHIDINGVPSTLTGNASGMFINQGAGWESFPSPGPLTRLAVADDGTGPGLFALMYGQWQPPSGEVTGRVAKWNGASWDTIVESAGPNGSIYALASYDDGTGPHVFIGGSFATINGVASPYLAEWVNGQWAPISGVGGYVYDMLVFDVGSGPELVLAGNVNADPDESNGGIARWNGSRLASVGSDPGGIGHVLRAFDDGHGPRLWFGGSGDVRNLSYWNGTTWAAATSSPGPAAVYSLAEINRTDGSRSLFFGGNFTVVGTVQSDYIGELAVCRHTCTADFDGDGDTGTDQDIEAFFACLSGVCCPTCGSADFNNDGDVGTDADIESFFRVLGGGAC